MTTKYNPPQLVMEYCRIFSGVTQYEGIKAVIYKWSGTDRTTIVWLRGLAAIGAMEMHYLDFYTCPHDIIMDIQGLSEMMCLRGWGLWDRRDMTKKRVFPAGFY